MRLADEARERSAAGRALACCGDAARAVGHLELASALYREAARSHGEARDLWDASADRYAALSRGLLVYTAVLLVVALIATIAGAVA